MQKKITPLSLLSYLLGSLVFVIGLLNLFLVHPVPGLVFILLSLVYLPQTNTLLQKRFGFAIPLPVKIVLGIVIVWFTLGVSDLGDLIDKLGQ